MSFSLSAAVDAVIVRSLIIAEYPVVKQVNLLSGAVVESVRRLMIRATFCKIVIEL